MLDCLQGTLILPIFLFHKKVRAEYKAEWRLGKRQAPSPGSAVPGRLGGQGLSGRRWHCTSSKAIGMSSSRAFRSYSLSSLEPPWPFHPVSSYPPKTPAEHLDHLVFMNTTGQKAPRGCSPPLGRSRDGQELRGGPCSASRLLLPAFTYVCDRGRGRKRFSSSC